MSMQTEQAEYKQLIEFNTDLHHAMRQWYAESVVPIVLNTSLNIKGQPNCKHRSRSRRVC